MSDDRTSYLNGVRPDGTYAYATVPDDELGRVLLRRGDDWPPSKPTGDHFRGPPPTLDADDLAEVGWGVVFPDGTPSAVRRALEPLLELRRDQAGDLYYELELYANEDVDGFLSRHGAAPGPADPERVPYYLLLVGGPEKIPFEFQWELDQIYAVGRIDFDGPEDYAAYARRVVDTDDRPPEQPRRLTFFGVQNEGDSSTRRTTEDLVLPLADHLSARRHRWGTIDRIVGPDATRAELSRLLGGSEPPTLLFTASHGMVFDPDDPRQRTQQGALLCSDWEGPGYPTTREQYFTAEDLSADARLPEIAFHFACHSGGSPKWDSFPELEDTSRRELAREPFVAALPKALLAHRHGTKAVIAHVDRAWTSSFDWNRGRGGPDKPDVPKIFRASLEAVLSGKRLGYAMEPFGALYGSLTRRFTTLWSERSLAPAPRATATRESLARSFRAANDARSFVVFGDPAVRLADRDASS